LGESVRGGVLRGLIAQKVKKQGGVQLVLGFLVEQ